MNPTTIAAEAPPHSTPAEELAARLGTGRGGLDAADVLARRALELAQNGDDVRALHMTDVALAVDPNHKPTLEARLVALKSLLAKCRNSIEANWLRYGIRTVEEKIKGEPPDARAR